MKIVDKCLNENGLFLLHTIGTKNPRGGTDPWLNKYIFPKGFLPSLRQIIKTSEDLFILEDLHNLSINYDKTLLAWHNNFIKSLEKLKDKYSERFKRMWEFYLLLCAGAFRARNIQVWQIVFSKGRIKETIKTAGLGTEAIPFKVGRAVGQFIEHQQKATAYITALNQGKGIKEALAIAEKAGFDYRALTRFESQIMRRLVPFYSFARKNVELQMKTLGENPQRINQVLRFFGNISEPISEEEKAALPDFIKESIGVKLQDTPEGLKQYISSFGTPIEAFTQLFGSNPILRTISMTNPILKVPTEIGIGKDSFRQQDLKDVYDAREYKTMPQVLKDLLEIKEVQKDVLNKNAQGKLIKVGTRTQYVADPVKLLIARSLFTSRGISYLDQVFGNDLKGFVKLVRTTTGIKPQTVDIEAQAGIKETKQKRALEDLLIRSGEVRKFQTVYEPKD